MFVFPLQWYNILQQASGAVPSRQAVEDLYLNFCQVMREGDPARYPQVPMAPKSLQTLNLGRRWKTCT